MTMPSILEQARARRAAQQQDDAGNLPRVLFVDDDERILHALNSLFRTRYEVVATTDGRHALELLRQKHFHLIVSDQRMPEIEGIEVLRQAKEISPTTVRILLTGFADLAAIVGSVNEGEVFRYINKPWQNDELERLIARAVGIGVELKSAQAAPGSGAIHDALDASLGCGSVLCIERRKQVSALIRAQPLDGVVVLDALTPIDALDTMHEKEIDVVVVAIDGDNRENFEFLSLLKREHPHVVAIVVSDMADATTVIGLINNARAFRVIFRPVKQGTLRLYIRSALKQADHYHHCPTLLKTQQAAKPTGDVASTVGKLSASIGARLSSIKSFFSNALHNDP